MIYIGIIWNTVNHLSGDILSDINELGEVVDFFNIDLSEQYSDFVRSIYELDGIAEWKVNKKLESMDLPCKNVGIVFIKVDDSVKEFNEAKKKVVSVNIETLKKFIRSKYSQLISNYFFDNVFHMTDNVEELANTLEVIRAFFPHVFEEYQNRTEPQLTLRREKKKNENKQ